MDRIVIRGGAKLERLDPDFRRQERRAAADDRLAADRPDADAGESAAARRRQPARAHPRQSRRRLFRRRQAPGRGRDAPGQTAHLRAKTHRRHDRALRTGVAHARELLGDRAAAGAHGRGARVAARRLRDRHAPGRPPADGAGKARRDDRDRRRLCRRQGAQGPASAARSISQGHGRGHPYRADGRGRWRTARR